MQPNRNSHYAVKNINGTSGNKCGCGSWIAHWYAATGSRRALCCVTGCYAYAEVGAHVQIDDGRFYRQWYIAPFCKGHNHYHNRATMYLKRETVLISAAVAITCGRADW